jgi:hypothetical protein
MTCQLRCASCRYGSSFPPHKLLHTLARALCDIHRAIRADGDVVAELKLARRIAVTTKRIDHMCCSIEFHSHATNPAGGLPPGFKGT